MPKVLFDPATQVVRILHQWYAKEPAYWCLLIISLGNSPINRMVFILTSYYQSAPVHTIKLDENNAQFIGLKNLTILQPVAHDEPYY